jgi:hypothetical protein
MELLPVAPSQLDATRHEWTNYILQISERDKCDPNEKIRMLYESEAQAFFVWDDDAKKVLAFLGVRYVLRGQERVGELIWLMGEHRASWVHLFADLETYLRDVQGCKAIKAIARPGWIKHLKSNGFRLTHEVMEKDI